MRYLLLFSLLLAAFPAISDTTPATPVPFEQALFDEALAQGRPVLVDVWASWCPTCRRQGRVLSELLAEERARSVADTDAQRIRALVDTGLE